MSSLSPVALIRRLREPEHLESVAQQLDRDPEELDEVLARVQDCLGESNPVKDGPRYVLYTDGASRNNPGPAGGGALILDEDGRRIRERSDFFGTSVTNNEAEYRALILGLDLVPEDCHRLIVRMDSELAIKQLRGEYQVRSDNLKPLFEEASSRLDSWPEVTLEAIPREDNSEADELANQAIDQALSE